MHRDGIQKAGGVWIVEGKKYEKPASHPRNVVPISKRGCLISLKGLWDECIGNGND